MNDEDYQKFYEAEKTLHENPPPFSKDAIDCTIQYPLTYPQAYEICERFEPRLLGFMWNAHICPFDLELVERCETAMKKMGCKSSAEFIDMIEWYEGMGITDAVHTLKNGLYIKLFGEDK